MFIYFWIVDFYLSIIEHVENYNYEKIILYSDLRFVVTMHVSASTWDRRRLNGSQDDCWAGSPRAIGARSLISFRAVSHSPIFCGRTWILPWRDATSKTRFPKRYSAGASRPPTTLECGESVRRERARVPPFHFFSLLVLHSTRHPPDPHLGLEKPRLND